MKTYQARIYVDGVDYPMLVLEQQRTSLGKDFIKNVELSMDDVAAGAKLIRSRIFCGDWEIACIRRDVYADGERITATQSFMRILNGFPNGCICRFFRIAE